MIIYFLPLSVDIGTMNGYTVTLMDIYNDCPLKNSLEIVFVAVAEVHDSVLNGGLSLHYSLDEDLQKRFQYIF